VSNAGAGVVDKNAAHGLRRDGNKVSPFW
jgi:hypothetical protein